MMAKPINPDVLQYEQSQAYVRQHLAEPSRMTQMAAWNFNASNIRPANPLLEKEKFLIDTTVRFCLERNISNIPPIFILDTHIPNAASVNGSELVFTSTLMNAMSLRELEAIIGHELSHHRHSSRDFVAAGVIGMSAGAASNLAWHVGTDMLHDANYISTKTHGTLKYHNVAIIPMWLAISASMVPYRFFQEYEADREGAELAGPDAMKNALNSLEGLVMKFRNEQGNEPRDWKHVLLAKILNPFASHPRTSDRIAAIEKLGPTPDTRVTRIQNESAQMPQIETGQFSLI